MANSVHQDMLQRCVSSKLREYDEDIVPLSDRVELMGKNFHDLCGWLFLPVFGEMPASIRLNFLQIHFSTADSLSGCVLHLRGELVPLIEIRTRFVGSQIERIHEGRICAIR